MVRKTAFVTGASRVTGKGIALVLGKTYDVGITYVNNEEGAMDTVQQIEKMGGRARAYKCDIRNLEAVRKTIDDFSGEFGRFDVLINNTGITRYHNFLETTEEQYDEVLDINLKGTYFTAQAAANKMVGFKNGGVILNISSVHAIGTWPGDSLYATTKAGICRLTQAMALDLAPHKIRVVCLAPGYIDTGWEHKREGGKARKERAVSRIPLHRFVSGEEVGGMCEFLVSEKAGYITGSTLFADGGVLLPVVADNHYP